MEAQAERVYSGPSLFCASYLCIGICGRFLLLSISSPKSFEDLRAVESAIHPTPKATCKVLSSENHLDICLCKKKKL